MSKNNKPLLYKFYKDHANLPGWTERHIFNCFFMPEVDTPWSNRRAISSFIIALPRFSVLFND